MIVAYIDEFKVHFGVEQICRVLTEHGITISPSTYYARAASPATDAELADAYTAHEVFCLFHDQRGLYGVLKLWHALRRRGRDIGRDQVARLMGICGITGIVRGKRHTVTTESDPSADRYPDLIDRKWNTPTRPDQWWVADFTYVWTLDGFCYVSFIVDVYVRRVQIGSFPGYINMPHALEEPMGEAIGRGVTLAETVRGPTARAPLMPDMAGSSAQWIHSLATILAVRLYIRSEYRTAAPWASPSASVNSTGDARDDDPDADEAGGRPVQWIAGVVQSGDTVAATHVWRV